MKIDILFLNTDLKASEDFINDLSLFEEYCNTHDFEGKANQIITMPASYSKKQNITHLVGIGEIEDNQELYELGINIGSKIKEDVEVDFLNTAFDLNPIIDGILYAQYKFNDYKSEDDSAINKIKFNQEDTTENNIKQSSVFWVRNQINTPALDKSPEEFIQNVNNLVESSAINVQVFDQKWLEKNNFGGVLGVAKGSDRAPYLVVGKYNEKAKYQISLIGKGVLFDSGGYSLKSPAGMETMKTDMSGAASAWGVINLVARTNQDIGLTVYTPIVENMVSGSAIRPGDVLEARNGKTIEVLNTDAEGRLIMADALAFASESNPDLICDIATLTGASYVALGLDVGAVFSNNKDVESKFIEAAKNTYEDFHPLPLYSKYRKQIDSDLADMKNTGGRFGGAITAALLLQEFVGDNKWMHLDIAGPARSDNRKGATGFGVLSLYEYFKSLS
ncbi:leucyl aminopeptidase family protein [Acidimicrobiaceae bacterium]|nr:leucyl aminopeptidase family protein [Acidimicrobiaceae bacterium]